MDPLKILQIVPRIAAESSGPSVSVPSLSRSLAELGHDVNLFTLEPKPKHQLFQQTKYFPTTHLPFCHRLGVSPSMKRAIRDAVSSMDIVHTNSLWMMPNTYPGTIRDRGKCKLVISPRGTVSDWALSRARLRKEFVWRLGQRKAFMSADCIHVTSMEEMGEVRKLGFGKPIAVIPNGVDCPEEYRVRPRDRNTRTCLFMARIHPKKGLDVLVDVWRELETKFADWRLLIAGPIDSDYAISVKKKIETFRSTQIRMVGEITGCEKKKVLYESDLYVLPTYSENFGISIAEALAHGIPSVVFKGAPWAELDIRNAGWWIDKEAGVLYETLEHAMQLTDVSREHMGRRAHAWVKSDFAWLKVAGNLAKCYQWLAGRQASVPAEIKLGV